MGGGVTLGYAPLRPGNSRTLLGGGGGGSPGLCTSMTQPTVDQVGGGGVLPWDMHPCDLATVEYHGGVLPWVMHPCDLATVEYHGGCYPGLCTAVTWQL